MKKNKSNIRKGIILGCMISAAILIGILSSYAYFISIGNNNRNQSANVQTGNMVLVFEDGSSNFQGNLNFGESAIKTFTIENAGSLEAKAKINWLNLTNTYLKGSLTYILSYSESEDGVYTEILTNKNVPVSEAPSTRMLVNNLIIPIETKYYYRLEITLNYLDDIDQTADLNAIFSTEFELEEGYEQGMIPLMVNEITNGDELSDNFTKDGNPDFAKLAVTDETRDGLYAIEDDYGMSYYYRGAVENNYVKFGGFYWRIIRINGDGSLRMIYDGTKAHPNGDSSEDRYILKGQPFNSQSNDAKYVGYMFGPSGAAASISSEEAQENIASSDIKLKLEEWYIDNLSKYDNHIADNIFCYDRSIPTVEEAGWNLNMALGYGANNTAYGGAVRVGVWNSLTAEIKPNLVCKNKNDKFSKFDTEKGNGELSEKIGLISVDEAVLAGTGKYYSGNNSQNYLYKGNWYYTGTPINYYEQNAYVFFIYEGYLNNNTYVLQNSGAVAPVISLTPEYVSKMVGDGTIGNEYRVL